LGAQKLSYLLQETMTHLHKASCGDGSLSSLPDFI
jgi:hypothetical protein